MKCSAALAVSAVISSSAIGSASAFAPSSMRSQVSTSSSSSSSSSFLSSHPINASRRDALDAAATGMVSFLVTAATTAASTVAGPPPALAEEPRPMYLTEPTDEFKANEAKSMEFKRQQLQVKKEFTTILETFLAEGNDADKLAADLKSMKGLVAKTGGLPLGIKKEELFKIIRSKKAKGFWPTPVEIAYQSLIQEISFQQSPNLDKEMGNPFQ